MVTIRIACALQGPRATLQSHCNHRNYIVVAVQNGSDRFLSSGLTAQARVVCNNTIPLLPKSTRMFIARDMDYPPAQQLAELAMTIHPTILPGYTARQAAAWLCDKRAPGFIYALQQPEDSITKLGRTNKHQRRLRELRWATLAWCPR